MLGICLVKVIVYFALLRKGNEKKVHLSANGEDGYSPGVDILLPMYNEAKVVLQTIENLLNIKYNDFSIVVIDDGSTDGSWDLVKGRYGGNPRVKLIKQRNAGKSAALNTGMSRSQSEIIVTIDADTWVRADALANIVGFFQDKRVAAVSGHIKVGNRVNLLTTMQYFEYVAIWDNDRAFSDAVNGILIVPGSLGAFRRSAADAVGGFRSEMIAEDTELTLRLLFSDYVIRNAPDAVAYTEAPDNLRMFFRQRVRWTTGLTQGLVKHCRKLFGHGNLYVAYLILPFTWLFRVLFPLVLPFADYYFLYAFVVQRRHEVLVWWFAVIISEAFVNLFILDKNGERVGVFKLILLQRLYRHLLFCNYWFIFAKWLDGSLFKWGKISRKGNIRLEEKTATREPEMLREEILSDLRGTEPY